MDKKQIDKNILDLEYHKLTQILNSILILTITSILGFLGSYTFLLNDKNKLILGLIISTLILIIIYGIILKINQKLDLIILKIRELSKS